jgi:hypothetical protein
MSDVETVTFSVEGQDGETDEITLPEGLVDLFAEEGDTRTEVVADVGLMAFVQRAHSIVHHSQGEPGEELEELEEAALDLFEERFGLTFGEATGHQH